jgi:hypothetical protein
MEEYYQDHRTYANGTNCGAATPASEKFSFSCVTASAGQSYLLTAVGISGDLTVFSYTLDQTGAARTLAWQTNAGWYVDLNAIQNSGERVSLDPEQQLGVLRIVSNVPDQVACRPTAQSWIYEFDYLTGSYLPLATRKVVARKISDSNLTAGMRTIKLGEKILGLLTDESGKVTNVSSAAPASNVISVKRVSWRELDEQ